MSHEVETEILRIDYLTSLKLTWQKQGYERVN